MYSHKTCPAPLTQPHSPFIMQHVSCSPVLPRGCVLHANQNSWPFRLFKWMAYILLGHYCSSVLASRHTPFKGTHWCSDPIYEPTTWGFAVKNCTAFQHRSLANRVMIVWHGNNLQGDNRDGQTCKQREKWWGEEKQTEEKNGEEERKSLIKINKTRAGKMMDK